MKSYIECWDLLNVFRFVTIKERWRTLHIRRCNRVLLHEARLWRLFYTKRSISGQPWCYTVCLCVHFERVNISQVVTGMSLHVGVFAYYRYHILPSVILISSGVIHSCFEPGNKPRWADLRLSGPFLLCSLPSFMAFSFSAPFIAMPSRHSTPAFLIKM